MPAQPILSWKNTGLFGVCLIALGTAYFFFDDVTTDRYGGDLLSIFGIIGMAGVLLAFIGLIGWAKQLGRQKRHQMAVSVFFAPWITIFVGYPIDGLNSHGSAALVFALIFLGAILAAILLIMGATVTQK